MFAIGPHASAISNINTASTSGTPIDTTGVKLIVIATADFGLNTVSDSNSNTWTPIYADPTNTQGQIAYYCVNPIVGPGHTFQTTGAGSNYSPIGVICFTGIPAASPLDQQAHAGNSTGSPLQPGSITPTVNNEVVISLATWTGSATMVVDSGFTIVDQKNWVNATSFGVAVAYLIQTTKTAVNPTWTGTGSSSMTIGQVSFSPAASGGGVIGGGVSQIIGE